MTSASELVDRFRAAGFNDRQAREIADAMVESRPAAAAVDAPLTRGDLAAVSSDFAGLHGEIRKTLWWLRGTLFLMVFGVCLPMVFIIHQTVVINGMLDGMLADVDSMLVRLSDISANLSRISQMPAELPKK